MNKQDELFETFKKDEKPDSNVYASNYVKALLAIPYTFSLELALLSLHIYIVNFRIF